MPRQPRRDEIITWVKTHGNGARFAVLDDENDELDELPLFQPSAATGISEEIAQGMAAYLLEETDKDMRHNRLERWFQTSIACYGGTKVGEPMLTGPGKSVPHDN
jgi:hypothetical protein